MLQTELKLKVSQSFWPSPQDYNEAVQNPQITLRDPELQTGQVYTDAIGIPRPVSGNFASVYRLKCTERDVALRCFLHNVADQSTRYSLISSFVQQDNLPCTVTFDFLNKGIQIGGNCFPALKMEWVDGESLDHFMLDNITSMEKLERLGENFMRMMNEMRAAGIAHGDLQHGNIIVLGNEELRLVDYDGMYVPGMEGMAGNELGHRNYQHPARTAADFSASMDNFSAWAIYTSIVALRIDTKLWYQLAAGDDCLLFKQSDFLDPERSSAFVALENHRDQLLRSLGRFLRAQLGATPNTVPHLQMPVPEVDNLPILANNILPIRQGPRVISSTLPEWLKDENVEDLNSTLGRKVTNHAAASPTQWLKPHAPHKNQPSGAQQSTQSGPATAKVNAPQVHGPYHQQSCDPELQQPTPRKVTYNPDSGFDPKVLQIAMILNPALWICLNMGYAAMVPDQDLWKNGQYLSATKTYVQQYQIKASSLLRMFFSYQVGGQTYHGSMDGISQSRGPELEALNTFPLRVSEKFPTYYESPGAVPGSKMTADSIGSFFSALLCLIFEAMIWVPAMAAKKLTSTGQVTLGRVLNLFIQSKSKGGNIYCVYLGYTDMNNRNHTVTLRDLDVDQYYSLKTGDDITIVYDPVNTYHVVIHRFARYKAILP